MTDGSLKVALMGIGKIARDVHLPVIAQRNDVELVAAISRNASVENTPSYRDLATALEHHPEIEAVVLCTPPQGRVRQAREAILAGCHVFLEKPPAATISATHELKALAIEQGRSLFASWHSRHGAAVGAAKEWLQHREVRRGCIRWKEDVRRWHPGQDWIFETGGMGVFDPGINALAIATHILPEHIDLQSARLDVPINRQAPIACTLNLSCGNGAKLTAEFDFLQKISEWQIDIETCSGNLSLIDMGNGLSIDGSLQDIHQRSADSALLYEYAALYDSFVNLIDQKVSDVDLRPFTLVADAFMLAERNTTGAFDW